MCTPWKNARYTTARCISSPDFAKLFFPSQSFHWTKKTEGLLMAMLKVWLRTKFSCLPFQWLYNANARITDCLFITEHHFTHDQSSLYVTDRKYQLLYTKRLHTSISTFIKFSLRLLILKAGPLLMDTSHAWTPNRGPNCKKPLWSWLFFAGGLLVAAVLLYQVS